MVQSFAKVLMMIVSTFPAGQAPEATLWYDDAPRNIVCNIVAGAEKDSKNWHEEWECFSFKAGCQTDLECESSEQTIGSFERGEQNGKAYKMIVAAKQ